MYHTHQNKDRQKSKKKGKKNPLSLFMGQKQQLSSTQSD